MTEGEFPKNRGTLLGSDLILGFGNAYKEIIKGALMVSLYHEGSIYGNHKRSEP